MRHRLVLLGVLVLALVAPASALAKLTPKTTIDLPAGVYVSVGLLDGADLLVQGSKDADGLVLRVRGGKVSTLRPPIPKRATSYSVETIAHGPGGSVLLRGYYTDKSPGGGEWFFGTLRPTAKVAFDNSAFSWGPAVGIAGGAAYLGGGGVGPLITLDGRDFVDARANGCGDNARWGAVGTWNGKVAGGAPGGAEDQGVVCLIDPFADVAGALGTTVQLTGTPIAVPGGTPSALLQAGDALFYLAQTATTSVLGRIAADQTAALVAGVAKPIALEPRPGGLYVGTKDGRVLQLDATGKVVASAKPLPRGYTLSGIVGQGAAGVWALGWKRDARSKLVFVSAR